MEQLQKTSTRKKFLLWGAALISVVTFSKFFSPAQKATGGTNEENKTVKMLTQDGRLVEVDKKLLASSSNKVTNKELQQWIKNNPVKHKTNQ